MIRFVITPGHEYTFDALRFPVDGPPGLPINVWTYPALFAATALPRGTWVFCDIERLAVWELRLAGDVARLLIADGASVVLNNPSRAAARYELLVRLHRHGFNRFRAWRAEDGVPAAAQYPVFLRLESNHGYPLSDLITTPEQLSAILADLPRLGLARRGVLIIEYCAEEASPGRFVKYAAYRIGDRIIADHLVQEAIWVVKYGNPESLDDAYFAAEADYVRTNPHAEALMPAFEIAGIDYGRADYGIVDGKVQVWEINTNPKLPMGDVAKAPPQRVEATRTAAQNRLGAIEALHREGDGEVAMESPDLEQHRKRQSIRRRDVVRD